LDKNEGSHGEYLEEWREVKIHGEMPPNRRDLRGGRGGGERDMEGGARDRGGRSGGRAREGVWLRVAQPLKHVQTMAP
jgi:hypothetical protein